MHIFSTSIAWKHCFSMKSVIWHGVAIAVLLYVTILFIEKLFASITYSAQSIAVSTHLQRKNSLHFFRLDAISLFFTSAVILAPKKLILCIYFYLQSVYFQYILAELSLKLIKQQLHLDQGWANSSPWAKCGPPQRFPWRTKAFSKIFKSEISSNL